MAVYKTAEDIRKILSSMKYKFDNFKFVRVGEEYRFSSTYDDHYLMVGKGEKPTSAGFFFIDGDVLEVPKDGSSTLSLKPAKDDEENIKKLILQI